MRDLTATPSHAARGPRGRLAAIAAGGFLIGAAAALVPAPAASQAAGGDAYARIQQLEEEIRRLNGRVERLENALRKASEDAGLRFNDMEFRLTDLEGGDTSIIGDPIPLGRGGAAPATGGPSVAVSEQAAFDSAKAALDQGDLQTARNRFTEFMANYGDGPLGGRAQHLLGETFFRMEAWRQAAQTFLSNVTGHPQGREAPDSLLKLGLSMERLGQQGEACLTLAEVGRRYPGSAAEAQAADERRRLACK